MNLTPEQRALGRENANQAIGSIRRRDFLRAAAVTPALGAFYFGYEKLDKPPVRAAIIGTGNEGCGAMIHDHTRDYLNFIGFCDIRPFNQKRARKEFAAHNVGIGIVDKPIPQVLVSDDRNEECDESSEDRK